MHPSAWNFGTQGYPNDKCKLTTLEDIRLQDCEYKTLIRKHTDHSEHTFQLVTLWKHTESVHQVTCIFAKYQQVFKFYALDKKERGRRHMYLSLNQSFQLSTWSTKSVSNTCSRAYVVYRTQPLSLQPMFNVFATKILFSYKTRIVSDHTMPKAQTWKLKQKICHCLHDIFFP